MRNALPMLALLMLAPMTFAAETVRLLTLGGDVTETVFALEAADMLIGVDTTSTYPAAARELPNVGYVRQLNAEGILALSPDLVIGTADAGPPSTLAQLRGAGLELLILPKSMSPADIAEKVRRIATVLQREAAGEKLAKRIEHDFARLAGDVAKRKSSPRVLFLLTTGPQSPLAAGNDTAASRMIELAGGINVASDFTGYKPLNSEALAQLAPDVILLMQDRMESAGGIDGVLGIPGLALTPAAKHRRVIGMDGMYLLGFGPRAAAAARELFDLLHATQ